MPRRLLDSDPQRERRRQMLLIERIERRFLRRYRAEIVRATEAMVSRWEVSGQVAEEPEHERRMAATLRQNWRSSIEALAGRVREQAKSAGYPVERKAEAQDAYDLFEQEYIAAFGAEKIQRVSRTTREQVRQQVERGRAAGKSVDEIAKSIRDRAPVLAGVRANTIARTETHSAGNFAATKQAKETGVPMRKEWIAANDERTRFSHAEADGQIVPMDAGFSVNGEALEFPGDPSGSAGNVINCRCAVGYVVDDG